MVLTELGLDVDTIADLRARGTPTDRPGLGQAGVWQSAQVPKISRVWLMSE